MSVYKANYRCEMRVCPGCGQLKAIPTRNMYCSRDCDKTLVTNTNVPQSDFMSCGQIDLAKLISSVAAQVTAEVVKKLPPQMLAQPKPQAQLWKQNEFNDGWTIIVSDVHIPYHHQAASLSTLGFFRDWADKGLLKRLILNGDMFDAASLSRHMKQRRTKFPQGDLGDEMKAGQPLIMAMASLFDECWFLGGNHEEGRLQRHLANEGIGVPSDPLAFGNLLQHFGYDGIRFVERRDIQVGFGDGGVKVFHGEIYNKHTAATILEKNRYQNAVQGHTHRPQMFFSKGQFGLVNGNLMSRELQDYMPDPDWTMGFTILEHFNKGSQVNPYFVKITEDGEFSFGGCKYDSTDVTL